jgi:hypothetical protein
MLCSFLLLSALVVSPANRDQTERMLETGRIVSMTDVGEGITGSQKVELEHGGRRVRAIFKMLHSKVDHEYRFAKQSAPVYRDSYRHEIAAYELDKLLGLGLVPVAVEREIQGRRGSLQIWVERVLRIFVHGQPPPDRQRADEQVHAVRLFDYLIFNTDRHFRNLLFTESWRPVLIDHSLAFHPMTKPPRHLHRFPRGLVENLQRLDQRQLKKVLGRYLEKDQLQALAHRRRVILELAAAAVAKRGQDALYEWSPGGH